ncbi:MAG: penicillin acylase family protein [Kiritimatiellae bacterium]|nr:penicillin acylase family protein [Kiritimatiellia bacterium]
MNVCGCGRYLLVAALFLLLLVAGGCGSLSRYKARGCLPLPGLTAEVIVKRDEKGMAYIYAERLDDALKAQGFVTAQDRLTQMALTRLSVTGRISELRGSDGARQDTFMRTIGFHHQAKRQAAMLDADTRRFLQSYVDGINAFMARRDRFQRWELNRAGLKPEPWAIEDVLCILLYMSWNSSGQLEAEILPQMLQASGAAGRIFPLNINPDDPSDSRVGALSPGTEPAGPDLTASEGTMPAPGDAGPGLGSNNWAVSPRLSPNGRPVVANDPHLTAGRLPGWWYPVGLIVKNRCRAVGACIPGIPALIVGRNEHIAVGVTNSYGDGRDMYVETPDPNDPENAYLEGADSIPFSRRTERLRVKDPTAPGGYREEPIEIKSTKRGPIISNVVVPSKECISLRWAPFETMTGSLGLEKILLDAKSTADVREALRSVNMIMLNFVFADRDGNIGWHASGRIPVRAGNDGAQPHLAKGGDDNWTGWIPFEEMPQLDNPKRGWIGTCNHKTVRNDYRWYYSSYFAPACRYERLSELLDAPGRKSIDDHWRFQRDIVNPDARRMVPPIAAALLAREQTREMGAILSKWDFREDPEQVAPTLFHALYGALVRDRFTEHFGEKATKTMLGVPYFWHDAVVRMVTDDTSPWFGKTKTEEVKAAMAESFRQAAVSAAADLRERFGASPKAWHWGKAHQIEFVHPFGLTGMRKKLFGGGRHPERGSAGTLCRAGYALDKPFNVTYGASLRMVADLGDDDKVLAVLPGGVCGRVLHRHSKDQIKPFLQGKKMYWWLSDEAIQKHTRSTLRLNPAP